MATSRPVAPDPYDSLPAPATFTVTSESVDDGETMPSEQVDTSAGGGGSSPQLSWSGAPDTTRGYVVTCFDPDAPTVSGFWHWIVAGIPADVTELPAGAGGSDGSGLPKGAVQLRNDGGSDGYMGAAPPAGDGDHRYIFTVHAVDEPDLGISAGDPAASASFATLAHEVGRARLTVTYQQ